MALILVVEDDHSINDLIVRNLALVGHSALSSFDGGDAIRKARETPST